MTKIFHLSYDHIISVDNLLGAWREFIRNKHHRRDVLEFEFHLMDNILILHRDLVSKNYRHQPYEFFQINDPKPRDIHKATVRDRLVHRVIYRSLYWFFHQIFIPGREATIRDFLFDVVGILTAIYLIYKKQKRPDR